MRCDKCGGIIAVSWTFDEDKVEVLDSANCIDCFQVIIMPAMTRRQYNDMLRSEQS